jgi:hypothetical protein
MFSAEFEPEAAWLNPGKSYDCGLCTASKFGVNGKTASKLIG